MSARALAAWREPSPLPGFGPAFGFTLFYVSVSVLVPLAALLLRPWSLGWDGFWAVTTAPRTLAALRVTFGSAATAALVNAVFGTIVAWVIVRYKLPAKRLVDAVIDLPFALPTSVAGIALTALYAPNGWLGEPLLRLGLKVAFTPYGIIIALIFVGLPFVVRTLEPVIQDFDRESEEAAATLGASRLRVFFHVILPT